MSHTVRLSDRAFKAFQVRAQRLGLSVEEYLDQSATDAPDDSLTPEMRRAIETGLEQSAAGQVFGSAEVRESLAQYREAWQSAKRG